MVRSLRIKVLLHLITVLAFATLALPAIADVKGKVEFWVPDDSSGGSYRPAKRVNVELEGNWLGSDYQNVTTDGGVYILSYRDPIWPFNSHDVNNVSLVKGFCPVPVRVYTTCN